jgi:hypothetical protein
MPFFPATMPDAGGRLDPFGLAFGPFVPDRFAQIHRDLAEAEVDPHNRDAWALSRAGAELLHELRPDDGLGEGVTELVALAHAGFLYWQHGERAVPLTRETLDALVLAAPGEREGGTPPPAYYLQLPARRVWGTPVDGQPPEPLDGWFAIAEGDRLHVVAVFGLLPGRPGFTVAHADGPAPGPLERADGTTLFSSTLDGGAVAGIWSIVGEAELLELGWRAHRALPAADGPAGAETMSP